MKYSPQALAALQSVPGVGRMRLFGLLEILKEKQVGAREFWRKPQQVNIPQHVLPAEVVDQLRVFQRTWSIQGYWDYLLEKQVSVITFQDQIYPALLLQLSDYPLVLFSKGNQACLQSVQIAVVGTRRPTRYGQWVTQKIVAELATHQVSITSGFMVGIDFQAHRVAQALGLASVGVLGFGFGTFYPAHLARAADEFLEAGKLLVTEYPPDHPPAPGQFPARNRIVAGLAKATLVIEAQERSGSLITANYALENNRVVGAVPGQLDSVQSQGTHALIQQGALLVTKGDDIWNEISAEL